MRRNLLPPLNSLKIMRKLAIIAVLSLYVFCTYTPYASAQMFEAFEDMGLAKEKVMEDYDTVKLRSLDKITARTQTFEAKVGDTVQFGAIYIKVQACRKAPPIEEPESAAFLQVWEITPEEESKWVFSGWMFASSPALSAMDHPVFDVWVLDCIGTNLTPQPEPEPEVDAESVSIPESERGEIQDIQQESGFAIIP